MKDLPAGAGGSARGGQWLVAGLAILASAAALSGKIGADIPWITVEAEAMRSSGAVLGPKYGPHRVEMESSGQRAVKLARAGEYVEFAADADFDALVLRYSLPDAASGGGTTSSLSLVINGAVIRDVPLSSRKAWLYGDYPFSNDPKKGKPRNFYDELRLKGLSIGRGDVVRLQKDASDGIDCVIDLVDLERVAAPLTRTSGSLSVLDYGARANGRDDDTKALRACIADAARRGGVVWLPAGDYRITGDIVVPSGVSIQGAGMWHTTFVGAAELYGRADRRIRFKLTGHDVHLGDFAIAGELDYRNDQEPNDGVVVTECRDASVSRIWVEHTKAGVWVYNGTRITVEGCRFRNLLADGVNFCVGTNHSVVQNCTARGTGDDCYAVWPTASDQGHQEETEKPGNNVIRTSTGQLPFLANGGSLYGGANNRIEDCLFTDISAGCGILISTAFPTASDDGSIDNNFSGETVVQNCRLVRCGGYDHSWAWRAAVQICLERRSIAGLRIRRVEIRDSLSDGLSVVAPGRAQGQGSLSNTVVEDVTVTGVGLGGSGSRGLWIRDDAAGGLTLRHSQVPNVSNESGHFEILTRPE